MGAYARDINMVPAIPSFPADIASKRVAYKRLLSRFKSPATLRSKSSTCVTSAAADAEAYNSGASSADAEHTVYWWREGVVLEHTHELVRAQSSGVNIGSSLPTTLQTGGCE